jgi:hypothetical protein
MDVLMSVKAELIWTPSVVTAATEMLQKHGYVVKGEDAFGGRLGVEKKTRSNHIKAIPTVCLYSLPSGYFT